MKMCTKCKIEFPHTVEHFAVDKRGKNGLASWCRSCFNKKTRDWQKANSSRHLNNVSKWRKANPYNVRKASLKRANFTPEIYDAMFKDQNGLCALCGTDTPGGMNNVLNADHDHNTGKPRGLLCWVCNSTLGKIELKPAEWIDKAKKYIEQGGINSNA
jgi:hypothetical protein